MCHFSHKAQTYRPLCFLTTPPFILRSDVDGSSTYVTRCIRRPRSHHPSQANPENVSRARAAAPEPPKLWPLDQVVSSLLSDAIARITTGQPRNSERVGVYERGRSGLALGSAQDEEGREVRVRARTTTEGHGEPWSPSDGIYPTRRFPKRHGLHGSRSSQTVVRQADENAKVPPLTGPRTWQPIPEPLLLRSSLYQQAEGPLRESWVK
ncbi:hypothetical protein LY76DRAFT_17987 [Colletotrichum caudatum]|nr:hypothetical protein LY76DRAFT_17987 [Colletotrichum caudatum]